jgi:hypothetical protein
LVFSKYNFAYIFHRNIEANIYIPFRATSTCKLWLPLQIGFGISALIIVSWNLKTFGHYFTARQLVDRNDHYLSAGLRRSEIGYRC